MLWRTIGRSNPTSGSCGQLDLDQGSSKRAAWIREARKARAFMNLENPALKASVILMMKRYQEMAGEAA